MRPIQTIIITASFLAISLLIYLNWQFIDEYYLTNIKSHLSSSFEKGDLNVSNVEPVLSGIKKTSEKVSTDSTLDKGFNMDNLNSYIQIENQSLKYFLLSFIIILVSEIGDKTFFIAALLAMKHSPVTVFCGSFFSLALMSVLSAALGHTIFNWLPKQYIGLLASGLFLVFGFKMVYDGYKMTKEEESAELLETEEELNEKNLDHDSDDIEGSSSQAKEHKRPWYLNILSPIFVQAFVLCFLAEWGDRSQISTITLAATGDILYVSLGTVLGHSICTAGAVLGGKYLAEKISVKKLTMLGGATFLVFAVIYFIESVYFEV